MTLSDFIAVDPKANLQARLKWGLITRMRYLMDGADRAALADRKTGESADDSQEEADE